VGGNPTGAHELWGYCLRVVVTTCGMIVICHVVGFICKCLRWSYLGGGLVVLFGLYFLLISFYLVVGCVVLWALGLPFVCVCWVVLGDFG